MHEDDVIGGKAAININKYTSNSRTLGLVLGDDDIITNSLISQITTFKYNNSNININSIMLLTILIGWYRSPYLTTIIDKVNNTD